MRKLLVLTALLLMAPAVSQGKSLEDLLVEKGVITKGEAQKATSGGASKVYWNNGTRLEFPDNGFTIKVNTLIQTRYTFTDADEDAGGKNTSSFSVNKARLYVTGTALHEEFAYYLNGEWAGGSASLRDAWLQWNACDWGNLRMGQYKTQVSRQWVNSDEKLQFPDRSVASDYFNLGRNQGLTGSAKWMDGALTGSAGLFNGINDGEGLNSVGTDTKHTGILALRWNPMGQMDSYSEGDVEWTEETAASFGLVYAYSQFGDDGDRHSMSIDGNVKSSGMSLHGEFYWARNEVDSDSDSTTPVGFYLQGGYFLDPKAWELVARFSRVSCDDGDAYGACSGNDNLNEVTAGVNYYWWKHNLKAQIAYVYERENAADGGGSDEKSNKWMLQLSSYL